MTEQSKLEWTGYKSRFRAVTAYGTYWVDLFESGTGYQLICGTNPCCEVFTSPRDAKDYAQTIHHRPSSRDDWFNLSDVEQAPYHAPVDLSDLLRTYETLLAGDNLPERIAVQTVDLRVLLAAAKPVEVAAVREAGFREGVEAAAKITDEFKSNNSGCHSPEAMACFTISKEMGQYIRALSPADAAQDDQLPQDVINLVIAAREVMYGGYINVMAEEINTFDKALEAFSSRVPWENEPDEPAAPTTEAGK